MNFAAKFITYSAFSSLFPQTDNFVHVLTPWLWIHGQLAPESSSNAIHDDIIDPDGIFRRRTDGFFLRWRQQQQKNCLHHEAGFVLQPRFVNLNGTQFGGMRGNREEKMLSWTSEFKTFSGGPEFGRTGRKIRKIFRRATF